MSNVGYATGGTGPFRPYIGWCDFNNISVAVGTTVTFSTTIPGVGILSYYMNNPAGSPVSWNFNNAGAWQFGLGYSGVPGFVGIFALSPSVVVTQTLNFRNITITDFSGNQLNKAYNVFVTQAEATISGEATAWTTDGGPWVYWATIPTSTINPTSSVVTGRGTQTIVETGLTPTPPQNQWSTFVASSQNPQNMKVFVQFGGEGTTFGIIVNNINTSKQVSTGNTAIGSILTYTIPIMNNSLDTLANLTIIDTLPNNVSFVSGSLKRDGATLADPNLPIISLADLSSFITTTVTFQVSVNGTQPNPIINQATVSGVQGEFQNSSVTNSVTTTINFASLSSTKYVNKASAKAGDTLLYTIVLSNSGNTSAVGVVINDTVPATTSYINGTLTGGVGTPQTITVPNIAGGRTATVTFSVLVSTTPNNPILNDSTTSYQYIFNPTSVATIPGATTSNQVGTSTASATISSVIKYASESYGKLGDTIQYSLVFTNTGNDTATNLFLIDTIPNNTTFIADSVYFNGNQQLGINPAPPTGGQLPNLGPVQTATVTFNVVVATLPSLNPVRNQGIVSYAFESNTIPSLVLSNQVATTINYSTLSSYKIVNKEYANLGDILTYTIPITNTGNTSITNIFFTDTIQNGTSYIGGSLKQDGVVVAGVSSLISASMPLLLGINKTSTITFQVQITTLPNPNPIQNTASIGGSYIIDFTTTPNRVGPASSNTNIAQTQINFATLGGITKYVDRSYATCGDTINYLIVAPNSGTVTAQNVVFRDTIPSGTILIPTSVYVNGIQQSGAHPSLGVTIPNIAPGNSATLTFSVQVQC